MLSPTNRVQIKKYHKLCFARGKKLLGTVRGYNGADKTKTTKVLEDSDLRVFSKYYIIGKQGFIP
jgi:hypothetical protein